ncbi:MAG: hypothetical protein ABIB47_01965 [Candidatus Woesearchaeota archaeon]
MDLSKLREKDQTPVREVVEYLNLRGLEVELKGSALRGDRQYEDVDLLATGLAVLVKDARNDLVTGTPLGDGYEVEYVGGPECYVNEQIDDRFRIQAGETKIDLSLKRLKREKCYDILEPLDSR